MVIALVVPLIPGPLGVVAAILVSVAVSVGSHFLIERPLARLKKRIHPRTSAGNPMTARSIMPREDWDPSLLNELAVSEFAVSELAVSGASRPLIR
jgi:hypothetical protein